ncbi:MAG: acyl-CoA synthetase [Candidatus Gastranaerophilales bacterium]|nr:acyl-CoA synthetase [Candidatus Gastranaerophilales bacterium]
MTADFLEYFYTEKFDEKILLKSFGKSFSVADVKKLVAFKMDYLKSIEDKTVSLDGENCFEFIINFFACIFSGKEIVLNNNQKSSEFFVLGTQTGNNVCEFPKINSKDVYVQFFTSGSSGLKKKVVKSLWNLIKEGQDLADEFGFVKGLEFVSTTTLNHLFGMTFHLMLPLNSGGVINTDRINYPENINDENLVLVSSPSFLDKMAKYAETPSVKLNTVFTAGAKLKDATFDYMLGLSKNVVEIYGSTESGVIAFRQNPQYNLKIFKNVRIVLLGNSAEISTPYSFEEKNVVNDEIELLTGREMKVVGRTDRVLKIMEKRISAEEVEKELALNSFVQDAYCLKYGEKLACLVALTREGKEFVISFGVSELKKNLKTFLDNKFEIIPQKWKFIDEIPKNINGKIDKVKIENLFDINLSLPLILDRKYSEKEAVIQLYFYHNCNFFKGHFENYPVLPGVVQLYFASFFAKDAFNVECTSGQFRKIKFSNLIKPDKVIFLRLEHTERGVVYSYFDEENTYSSGQLPIRNYWRE